MCCLQQYFSYRYHSHISYLISKYAAGAITNFPGVGLSWPYSIHAMYTNMAITFPEMITRGILTTDKIAYEFDRGTTLRLASMPVSRGIGIPVLRSSTRQAILTSLAINRKLRFTDLMKMTVAGEGSLWNHIDQMEQAHLLRKSKISFFSSSGMYVEIADYGLKVYEELLTVIRSILKEGKPEGDGDVGKESVRHDAGQCEQRD